MKNILFLMLFSSAFLSASNLSNLYKMYEKQEYDKACNYAMKYFNKNKNAENYLTLYGLSCLETNNIERIATPMLRLKKSKDARANAAYFSTILLQKELLFQALVDKISLKNLQLPNTEFILSKIFTLFSQEKYSLKNEVYTFKDKEKQEMKYKLYIKENSKKQKQMILDIYKEDKFTHRYTYQ